MGRVGGAVGAIVHGLVSTPIRGRVGVFGSCAGCAVDVEEYATCFCGVVEMMISDFNGQKTI